MERKEQTLTIIQAAIIAFVLMIAFQTIFGNKQHKDVSPTRLSNDQQTNTPYIIPSQETGEIIKIDTPLYTAKVSSINGKLLSIYIKRYRAELVSKKSQGTGIFPLMTVSSNKTTSEILSHIKMKSSHKVISINGTTPSRLHLYAQLPDGRTFEKTYIFYPDNYRIDLKQKLSDEDLAIVIPEINVNEAFSSRMGHIGPVIKNANGKTVRPDKKELNQNMFFSSAHWAGQEDKYFIICASGNIKNINVGKTNGLTILTGFTQNTKLYAGPKELTRLSELRMEDAIDFGIFAFLAKPFLKFFLFIHKFIPDYGIVIIILTIIIKLILHPLTHKSYESMKKMQKLAPKMEELKKRYKNNPQKLNEELMKLYKKEGINPMGGCLPMILQIPIFFALYEIFLNAVELKGFPFLWVPDLSATDPTYILPILMGASMILQQKLTPATNPQQEKIFLIMAVVFTFMFATFPAGLVLYWLTNNIITAIQNIIINSMIHRKA